MAQACEGLAEDIKEAAVEKLQQRKRPLDTDQPTNSDKMSSGTRRKKKARFSKWLRKPGPKPKRRQPGDELSIFWKRQIASRLDSYCARSGYFQVPIPLHSRFAIQN